MAMQKINTILVAGKLGPEAIEVDNDNERLIAYIDTALQTGIAHFQYSKIDGSLRTAFGTRNPKLIPSRKAVLADEMFDTLKNLTALPLYLSSGTADSIKKIVEEIEAGHKPARDHGKGTITYYDFECKAFRSFLPENLLAIY